MKTKKFQRRAYRKWVFRGKLRELRARVGESDLQILSDIPLDKKWVLEKLAFYRQQIEDYISGRDSRFFTALKPLSVEPTAPPIVRAMAEAGRKAGVGPMAAVAGAIAQFLGTDLLTRGCREVIVENGGDIFIKLLRPARVGLYAGSSPLSGKLMIRVRPEQTPCGICTSSGTVGHSLSFGSCDSATVICRDALLADACATALGNRVDSKNDMARAIGFVRGIRGVRGALVVIGKDLAGWGEIELLADNAPASKVKP